CPLNMKDELRPVTRSPLIFDRSPMISSVIPSLKYSSSLLALRLANGNTATVGEVGSTAGGGRRIALTMRVRSASTVATTIAMIQSAAPVAIFARAMAVDFRG